MVATGSKVAFAFGLTVAAGLATLIGGLVIFSRKMVYLANPRSLALALSVSCGVMLFISLVEIIEESKHGFEEALGSMNDTTEELDCDEYCEGGAWLLTIAMFALGVGTLYLLDAIVHYMIPEGEDHKHSLDLTDLQALQDAAAEEVVVKTPVGADGSSTVAPFNEALEEGKVEAIENKANLNRTGLLTALAITLHNIPEGVATYAAAMNDTRFGLALAVGIALHNIPEGIAVAAPVYFATGSRTRGFMWTFISAVAEPLGGVLAWLIIGNGMDPVVNGVLFGFVAGMMVTICLKEMLPTARIYAPTGHLVGIGVFSGMLIMALSLALFAFAGV